MPGTVVAVPFIKPVSDVQAKPTQNKITNPEIKHVAKVEKRW